MRECNSTSVQEEVRWRTSASSMSIRGRGSPGTCCWRLFWTPTEAEAGWSGLLKDAVAALGLDGTTVEVTRDVEWGVACTRVRVREGRRPASASSRDGADHRQAAASARRQVRARALAAVRRLAEVEAAVHGCSVEEIHFHEVGAVDTLVDVVGTFALGRGSRNEHGHVGTIPVGGGTVEIAHGRMGVPAPATVAPAGGLSDRGRSRRPGADHAHRVRCSVQRDGCRLRRSACHADLRAWVTVRAR